MQLRAAVLAAKLERLTEVRAGYHRKYYGEKVQDVAPVYEIDPSPDLPPQAGESLADYLERTLGDAAILPAGHDDNEPPPSTERRRRLQRMEQAAQVEPVPQPFL